MTSRQEATAKKNAKENAVGSSFFARAAAAGKRLKQLHAGVRRALLLGDNLSGEGVIHLPRSGEQALVDRFSGVLLFAAGALSAAASILFSVLGLDFVALIVTVALILIVTVISVVYAYRIAKRMPEDADNTQEIK